MNLKNELSTRAALFNKQLELYMNEKKPKLLYDASWHLPRSGGKRLRPCLAMLSCESVYDDVDLVMPFAVALELVHNFTLVHDDIMDRANLRRNVPTVHMKYGEPTAIMAGDLLFAKAFEAMHDLAGDLRVFKEVEYNLVKCIEDICEGQQLDMEFEKRKQVSEDEYFDMIHKKTAVLFSCAAKGSGLIGHGTSEEVKALADFGMFLGLAFQIWDDYLDLSSSETVLGKDIGNDIRNGKKTLIAVHALEHADKKGKALLDKIFGNPDAKETDIKQILTVFRENGSVDYAKQTAMKYCKKAKKALEVLRDSQVKDILNALADYSIEREK